jgi:hypothetical protein
MKKGFTGVLTPHLVVRAAALLFRIRKVYPDQDIGYPEQDYSRPAQSIWAVYRNNTPPETKHRHVSFRQFTIIMCEEDKIIL